MSLPMHPDLDPSVQAHIVRSLADCVRAVAHGADTQLGRANVVAARAA